VYFDCVAPKRPRLVCELENITKLPSDVCDMIVDINIDKKKDWKEEFNKVASNMHCGAVMHWVKWGLVPSHLLILNLSGV
jgi:hypothetical protein